jgi:hypothetical protein
MVSFRLIALTIMAAGLSVASDPFSSIGMPSPTKALFHDAIRPTPQGSYGIASSLVAFTREQVSNSDGSAIQVTKVSFQIFSTRLTVTLESGIVTESPKSSVPARFVVLSPEIVMVLSKQCSLMSQPELTCKADAMDATKPSSVNNVLAWFANTLVQAPRAALRYAITALTPKASAPTRFVSPDILNILSKQCPLIVTTCEVDAMDIKPVTVTEALRVVYRYAITALTIGTIAYVASGFTMLASKVYLFAILLALAHSVIDDVPAITTAMLIFGISIFASTLYFCAVTVKCWFKSPIKTRKRRVSNSTIAELCDDVFGYVRKVLFTTYVIMFGSWQVVFGWVGDDPLKVLTQVVGTMVAAFIAKKLTEIFWYYCWLVWIHACVSTVQFMIVNPCCIASDFVKNAFQMILSTVFRALRTATISVLRTVCGSFFKCENWHLGKPRPACR